MTDTLLESARKLYEESDYEAAAESFDQAIKLRAAKLAPGEVGYAHHMIGNCHMKQHRYEAAIMEYQHALADNQYPRRGSLCVNLGKARMGLKQYDVAAECFKTALNDADYTTPYKALMALGNIQMKQGDPTAAGTSYRRAALDASNPDPAKSLVNLGVCFMALDRPSDAVESYVTALKFTTDEDSMSKTYANLGQAYVATGRMEEAVDSFEKALENTTYRLSDAAQVDYERAKRSLEEERAVDSGLDNFNSLFAAEPSSPTEVYPAVAVDADDHSATTSIIPPADDTGFFTVTEEEMNQQGKEMQRVYRKRKNIGPKIVLIVVIVLVLLAAAAGFFYYKGYGYPLQETVVQDMFSAYAQGEDVSPYWADANATDLEAAMSSVAASDQITIDAVERTINESVAHVTVTLPEGGQVHYNVNLARDSISWKINSVSLDFASRDY